MFDGNPTRSPVRQPFPVSQPFPGAPAGALLSIKHDCRTKQAHGTTGAFCHSAGRLSACLFDRNPIRSPVRQPGPRPCPATRRSLNRINERGSGALSYNNGWFSASLFYHHHFLGPAPVAAPGFKLRTGERDGANTLAEPDNPTGTTGVLSHSAGWFSASYSMPTISWAPPRLPHRGSNGGPGNEGHQQPRLNQITVGRRRGAYPE